MCNDIECILYSPEQLAAKVAELAASITRDYRGKRPILVGILKGSFIFMSDLVRRINLPCEVDFLSVSSYGMESVSSGSVRLLKDLDTDIRGRDILLIEDILDSGMTLSYIMSVIETSRPASVAICTLFDKPERRRVPVEARYSGFLIPDEFIVGYGLDFAGQYRNLPYVGVLKRSIYEE